MITIITQTCLTLILIRSRTQFCIKSTFKRKNKQNKQQLILKKPQMKNNQDWQKQAPKTAVGTRGRLQTITIIIIISIIKIIIIKTIIISKITLRISNKIQIPLAPFINTNRMNLMRITIFRTMRISCKGILVLQGRINFMGVSCRDRYSRKNYSILLIIHRQNIIMIFKFIYY